MGLERIYAATDLLAFSVNFPTNLDRSRRASLCRDKKLVGQKIWGSFRKFVCRMKLFSKSCCRQRDVPIGFSHYELVMSQPRDRTNIKTAQISHGHYWATRHGKFSWFKSHFSTFFVYSSREIFFRFKFHRLAAAKVKIMNSGAFCPEFDQKNLNTLEINMLKACQTDDLKFLFSNSAAIKLQGQLWETFSIATVTICVIFVAKE